MVDNMLKSVRKALKIIEELQGMDLETLKDICSQYGEDFSSNSKDDLIRVILKIELSNEELEDYERYLKYQYFMLYKQHEEGIQSIDKYVDGIRELYSIKDQASREERTAQEKERKLQFALSDVLPLVRISIEYGHVERGLDDYIKVRTKTGLKLGKMRDEIDDMKARGLIYQRLNRKAIEKKEKTHDEYWEQASKEVREARVKYESIVGEFAKYFREAFYKLLDRREIAEAVQLYRTIPSNFEDPSVFKVQSLSNVRFEDEEKEEIYDEFIKFANFDPEEKLTAERIYDAVLRFVCQYYKVMASRNSLRQSNCVNAIREIVEKERQVVDSMKINQQQFYDLISDEAQTLSLTIEDGKKKK